MTLYTSYLLIWWKNIYAKDALYGRCLKSAAFSRPCCPRMIGSFHEGMSAEVRVGDKYTNSFTVNRGLRKEFTLIAPTLFSLYFNAMVAKWRSKCPQAGVLVRYVQDRKEASYSRRSSCQSSATRGNSYRVPICWWWSSLSNLERGLKIEFVKLVADWELTVNLEKTKFLAFWTTQVAVI